LQQQTFVAPKQSCAVAEKERATNNEKIIQKTHPRCEQNYWLLTFDQVFIICPAASSLFFCAGTRKERCTAHLNENSLKEKFSSIMDVPCTSFKVEN
jgi:hypothetical protein